MTDDATDSLLRGGETVKTKRGRRDAADTFTGPGDTNPPMPDAAPCRKCTTRIAADATRCPQCGYDPTPGLLATVALLLVFGPWAGFGIILGVVSAALVLTGLTLAELAGVWAGTLILCAPAFGYVAWYGHKWTRTAAGGS
jgi:hypothetical protein